MVVSILIPAAEGREDYLARCLRGYADRTPGVDLEFVVVRGRPTCGQGWQACAEQAHGDYWHFSNDDVVPGEGWLEPLIEVCEMGAVAAPWIEPAKPELLDYAQMPLPGNPLDPTEAGAGFNQSPPQPADLAPLDHGAMPFCTPTQFALIGPWLPTHYGIDGFFAECVRAARMELVASRRSIIYHYCALAGRAEVCGDWDMIDLLDYDCVIAREDYRSGRVARTELPPDRLTPEGLRRAREWRMASFPRPHHWER